LKGGSGTRRAFPPCPRAARAGGKVRGEVQRSEREAFEKRQIRERQQKLKGSSRGKWRRGYFTNLPIGNYSNIIDLEGDEKFPFGGEIKMKKNLPPLEELMVLNQKFQKEKRGRGIEPGSEFDSTCREGVAHQRKTVGRYWEKSHDRKAE